MASYYNGSQEFARGFPISRLNYGIIALVPKNKDAKQIQKFRPICLLNVSFKILTKVLMNKLSKVVNPIISPIQTTFGKGRYIMEGVVILHEALNSFYGDKEDALIFKVDFGKAYDKIKWPFVIQVLELKGFPDKWCDWVMETMRGGHVGVKVNDEIGPYFKTFKGLRQGDPVFPLLYIIAIDPLHKILDLASRKGLFHKICGRGVAVRTSLYSDDAAVFMAPIKKDIDNLATILHLFGNVTGLVTNFQKSSVVPIRCGQLNLTCILQALPASRASFPMKYLGLPVDKKE